MRTTVGGCYRLSLLGSFWFENPQGERIMISSKRSRALLGMLATADKGERSRRWLETNLWANRSGEQAKASLRKELFNLRKLFGDAADDIIGADANSIWLNLDALEIDVRQDDIASNEAFLEGLDLRGEDAFEDWLRERRAEFSAEFEARVVAPKPTNQTNAQPPAPPSASTEGANPAIAVLPFRFEPPNEELDYVAFGIGEELINRLSRLRWLSVIARSSSFAAAINGLDARAAGKALGARYVVEGSFRPAGKQFRFQIALTDASTGRSLWSETVAIDQITDMEAVEAALDGIAAALDQRVDQSEQLRAVSAQSDQPEVRKLVWRARWHFAKLTGEDMEVAAELLDKAEQLEPASAEILIEKAWLQARRLWLNRGAYDEIRALRRLAQKASIADPDDARGYMIAGIAEFWLQQPERAEKLFERAIDLNPSLVMAHAQLGSCWHHRGKSAKAVEALETARSLSPNDQDLFYTEGELAMAYLGLGEPEKALAHAEASLARRAAYWSSHVAKINALVALGDMSGAQQAYEELMLSQPRFAPHFIDWLPYRDIARNEALREGLNQAAS
jgi:TolB-like protein